MKLDCKIRGFRGAERCDITIDPVCLAAGLNFAGKSSLAQAVAAAVCGTPIPYFKDAKPDKALLTKTDAKELLRGGMDAGSVEIFADGKLACSVKWPDLESNGNGTLQCSKYAAGLVNVMGLDDGERQKFFAGLLQAMPTMDDLRLELMEKVPGLGDEKAGEHLKMLLDKVTVSGWDPAHTSAKEVGSRAKGQWEAHSQERYGASKAEGWIPKGWHSGISNLSLEEIGSRCTQAQEKWQQAAAQLAVDAATIADLQAAAAGEAALYEAMQKAKEEHDACARVVAGQKVKIAGCQLPQSVPCPHCGGLLEIRSDIGGFKVAEATMWKEERNAATLVLKKEQEALADIQTEQAAATKAYDEARTQYQAVAGSAEKLKAAQAKKGTQEAVDVALDYLNGLQKDKAMIEAVAQCTRLHALIQANQKIVDILAPEGLRRQKLVRALAKFNQKFLAALCQEAEYPAVTLDNDLEVLYGSRRYFLLSTSEQYRVRCVLQTAIGLYDKSPLIIFDGSDVLDAPGRNGLFAMMQSCESLSFLVCMTVADRKKVPDLAAAGMGASYWIESGIAEPIGAETVAA